ncbi:hypothetical protein [Saccharothrix sp. ST-888]|uniref:hypothetical protein n=1 Tax=Saccharothrix sp. ST-888 TaxID=1427391 RepID=UPI0005ED2264|nr:hypothetical protein [Saccharothrix sp. ST-888]
MRDSTTPDRAGTGAGRPLSWLAPVTANLGLGYLGILPLGMAVVFVRDYPLVRLGLGTRDPNDNDGILPWLILLTIVLGFCLGLWFLVNLAVRRMTDLHGPRYWPVSGLTALLPTGVFSILPDSAWRTPGWF